VSQQSGTHGHGDVSIRIDWEIPAHSWYWSMRISIVWLSGIWVRMCWSNIITSWASILYWRLHNLMPPKSFGTKTMLQGRFQWYPILFKIVNFCRTFGYENSTKFSKQMDGPQWRLGTEQRLARRARRHTTKEKWQWDTSKRKCYLSFLCIVFSQEDGHPRVREVYRWWWIASWQSNTKENLLWLAAKRRTTCIDSWAMSLRESKD